LSEVATEFMRLVEGRSLDSVTVTQISNALWYFFEFVGADVAIGELDENIPEKFLHWLRTTPIAPRKRKGRANTPTSFDAESVAAFFDWIGWRMPPRGFRNEATVHRFWAEIAPFFELLDPHYRPDKVLEAARENGRRLAATAKATRRRAALEGNGL
jgi:hypothetical protein